MAQRRPWPDAIFKDRKACTQVAFPENGTALNHFVVIHCLWANKFRLYLDERWAFSQTFGAFEDAVEKD
ncbi:hypothetical protein L596_029418 [Steinernema carpocapsae]|uniref:Uncharacterized protein n=1 Tax=Steinernema carpocapsae TaxID=34508 RepID=A0A4U5LUL6_STECR|nr:hypothetical protein L596_029418 [Steinernema carpocapsae]